MPAYPKIWTSIRSDLWFKELKLTSRGVFLLLIIIAKDTGDTGLISWRSWAGCGDDLGCDGKTARKILGKFQENGKITLEVLDSKMIIVNLLNYLDYQKLTKGEQVTKRARKIPQNGENSPLNEDEIKGNEVVEGSVTTYDPNIIKKVHKITYDQSKKPIENLLIWNETDEAKEMGEAFKCMVAYPEEFVNLVFDNEFIPHVTIKHEESFKSLFDYHNGSWKNFFMSWLSRAKKGSSWREYMKGKVDNGSR